MWFLFTLFTTCAWGTADLFYKKGADENDRYSHLRTAIAVGIVMGIHAVYTLISKDISYDFRNLYIYLPVSAMYILSMVIGYLGLRYLELSISSPIQNSSGAICAILCLLLLGETMSTVSAIAVIMISIGLFLLGLLEKLDADKLAAINEKKYRIGFVAIILPLIYCIIDSLGTFFDAYYLDDFQTSPLVGITEDTFEDVANTSYEFTFLICAVILSVFLLIKKFSGSKSAVSQSINATNAGDTNSNLANAGAKKDTGVNAGGKVFALSKPAPATISRFLAAIFETAGQATYVYALSANPAVAAPVISSYSIVSLILSRIFLREKLSKFHYLAIAIVIAGVAILGFLDEM